MNVSIYEGSCNASYIIRFLHRGFLEDHSKPIIFTMAWLDRVKNLIGLVRWFCENSKLRQMVNLVVVGGDRNPSKSKDMEEAKEIETMHSLIEEYNLFGQFRWICTQKNRVRNGELYRYIADTRGAFIQVSCLEIQICEKSYMISIVCMW